MLVTIIPNESELSETYQQELIAMAASIMGISPTQVSVAGTRQGSTMVYLIIKQTPYSRTPVSTHVQTLQNAINELETGDTSATICSFALGRIMKHPRTGAKCSDQPMVRNAQGNLVLKVEMPYSPVKPNNAVVFVYATLSALFLIWTILFARFYSFRK